MQDTKEGNQLAVEVLNEFLNKREEKTQAFSFLRALVALLRSNSGDSYQLVEIQEQLKKQFKISMSKPARETKGAIDVLKNNRYQLALIAKESGHSYIPSICKERKPNGKSHYYSVSGEIIDVNKIIESHNEEQETTKSSSPELEINHVDEIIYNFDVIDPKRLQALLKLDLNKHWLFMIIYSNAAQILFYLGILMFIFMLSFIPMLNGTPPYLLGTSTLLIIVGIILWIPLHSYHLAWKNNVSSAPDHLIKNYHPAVLLYELKTPGSERRLRQKLQLMEIHAVCPICEQRVEVVKKRSGLLLSLFSSSNLVGRCRGNPLLHKFTFDFTKRNGKLI